ncbi:MAG TPA: lipoprotein [Pseudidiomarina sp.]|nr:lipoprotein [Pseudidiomarina sp.]
MFRQKVMYLMILAAMLPLVGCGQKAPLDRPIEPPAENQPAEQPDHDV